MSILTRESNSNLLKIIDILENRLKINIDDAREVENNNIGDYDGEEDDDLFSPLHRITYTHMLGETYFTLVTEYGRDFYFNNPTVLTEFGNRAETAFRSAVNLAAMISLEPTSQLRLLTMCSLCRCLVVLRRRYKRAQRLSTKLFTAATLHSQQIADDSLGMLQILRDTYMPTLTARQIEIESQREEVYSSDDSSDEEDDDVDSDEDDLFDEDGNRIEHDVDNDNEEGEVAVENDQGDDGCDEVKADDKVGFDPTATTTTGGVGGKTGSSASTTPKKTTSKASTDNAASKSPKKVSDKSRVATGADVKVDPGEKKAKKSSSKKASKEGRNTGAAQSTNKSIKSPVKGEKERQAKKPVAQTAEGAEIDISWMAPRQKQAVNMVKGLRKIAAQAANSPVLLESPAIPQAAEMHRALSRIFAVYVRGAGLPAHAGADYKVSVDGQRINFSSYVLAGPYISFRGICGVLRDFGIAKLPNKKKVPSFPQIHDNPPGAVREFRSSASSPPLTIKEAVLLFIECSRSSTPCLTLESYFAVYKELAEAEKAANVSGAGAVPFSNPFDDSTSPQSPINGLKYWEPWGRALIWAGADQDEWGNITCGLNFMQFIDFLGKVALVTYASPRFEAAFPTSIKKIEHFLSAQLGLMDSRRWLPKVDARITALKYMIEDMTSKAVESTPHAAAATTAAMIATQKAKLAEEAF